MALDTVSKRFSTIHLGSPWRGLLPIPDGTIGQGDRQHVMFLSSAVLADVVVVSADPGLDYLFPDSRLHYKAPGKRLHYTFEGRLHYWFEE